MAAATCSGRRPGSSCRNSARARCRATRASARSFTISTARRSTCAPPSSPRSSVSSSTMSSTRSTRRGASCKRAPMASIALKGIGKSFGTTGVLSGIDLAIADGEFITLVGPSGCGKSTLIRIIAGLEPQSAGSIEIGGRPIDHLRPHERRVAMVFQSYALYPHMSVADNIALPLTMQRLSVVERLPLVKHLSPRRRRVMREVMLARKPAQLSGGQRQRVALGRAMVRHPDVFLMDEPLSNLDAKLRVHMRSELAELHMRLATTFVYVTHDQVEAMTMSDRVAMMDAGRILQLGTPTELYTRPATLKVAQFIGSPAINVLPGIVDAGGRVAVAGVAVPVRAPLAPGSRI